MRRLVLAVSLIVVVVLVAGAGLVAGRTVRENGAGPTPVAPTGGPAVTTPPSPGLARFYSQRLDWSACGGGHRCAELTVPLDYDDPSGRTLRLAVLEDPADGSMGTIPV